MTNDRHHPAIFISSVIFLLCNLPSAPGAVIARLIYIHPVFCESDVMRSKLPLDSFTFPSVPLYSLTFPSDFPSKLLTVLNREAGIGAGHDLPASAT